MYEMCSAISHIYKQHILHNDIKSNNFVVEEVGNQNRTVLTDFGKATKINNQKGKRQVTQIYYCASEFPGEQMAATFSPHESVVVSLTC